MTTLQSQDHSSSSRLYEKWRKWWVKVCRCVYSYWWWEDCRVSMPCLKMWEEKLTLQQVIDPFFFFFFGCLRQCKSTAASGSPSGEAFYFNLQRVEGPRWDSEASALAGCPKPDASELSAWPKRQCEWTAACGARLLHQRHFSYHHPQGGLPRWRLLHLHLWHASVWIETGTDLPHCYRWVRTAAALDKTYVTVHTVTLMGSA